jgi:uncharacterized membrane protein
VYEAVFVLHIFSAFALVAGEVLYSFLLFATRGTDVPSAVVRNFRLSRVGDWLVGIGMLGVLVFGIWLAIDADAFQVWDGWVIGALVLWAVFAEVARRAGKVYNAARDRARELVAQGADSPDAELNAMLRSQSGFALQLASIVLVLLLIVDMIYKPGA